MSRRIRTHALLAAMVLLRAVSAPAQSESIDSPPPPPVPFVAVNIASIDRVLSDTEFMFTLIERPDLYEALQQLLGDKAGQLNGFDREKPFGMMLFLEPGFPPRPMPIVYLPAKDLKGLMETINLSPFDAQPVPGKKDRYELKGPGPKQYARLRNGYAMITASEILIDQELPDPVEFNQTLTARYDIAVTLRISSVPPVLRDVFLGFFRAQAEGELQRRDDEPEGAYKIRRANGLSTIEGLQELLTDGDQFTIGLDANQSLRKAVIELNLQATPDSAFAKSLHDVAGRTSFFAPIQEDSDKPFTAAVSSVLNARERKAAAEVVEGARIEVNRVMTDEHLDPLGASSLFDVLTATAQEGHIDAYVQIAEPKKGQFVVTGALKMKGADAAGVGLAQLVSEISKLSEVKGLELNQDSHQGVAFHRIKPESDEEEAKRFFGGTPAFWFGAGQRAFWFTGGGEEAMPTLKDTMDRILGATPPAEGSTIPFVLVFRRAKFFSIPAEEDPGSVASRELSETAFNSNNDKLRIETRPTENGLRSRIELDEGFVRWLGLMIAKQYDESQL